MIQYPAQLTLEQARRLYFERNGFGPSGGYDDEWVVYEIGPFPFPFPNTAARVRAVRFHDLHHVLTGYETSLVGETEIAAWEVATGCAFFPAALHLNLAALGIGVMIAPRAVLRAYARGRRSRNLYGRSFDSKLLGLTVARARAELGLGAEEVRIRVADVLRFVPVAAFSLLTLIGSVLVVAPLAAIAWPFLLHGSQQTRPSISAR